MPVFGTQMFGSAAEDTYRYFRITVSATESTNEIAIRELKIMVDTTQHPTSALTSDSAPSPFVSSASSIDGSSRAAWKGFDRSDDHWGSAFGGIPGWLKIDLGSGNDIAPTAYKITAGDDGKQTHAPKTWTFEGSNNDSDWETLDTQTTVSNWSADEERTYTL